jgi:hypothetical protein
MKFSELSRLNTKKLKYILKQNKIKNYSNMNKVELLKKIKEINEQKGGSPKYPESRRESPAPMMLSFNSGRVPNDFYAPAKAAANKAPEAKNNNIRNNSALSLQAQLIAARAELNKRAAAKAAANRAKHSPQ